MNLRHHWIKTQKTLLDLLFPPRCVHCRKTGALLCPSCLDHITPFAGPVCPTCSRALPSRKSTCGFCRAHPPEFDRLRAVAPFDGPLRRAIHVLKYNNLRDLANPLGDLLLDVWEAQTFSADMIVPVPLHQTREQERGYNQSTLLAERLAQRTGLPVVEQALRRTRQTPPQVGLSARERWLNVQGAFEASPAHVAGHRPLLIDDVLTTGATLSACAHTLREQGAQAVYGLTLARPL
ncbi:MAG: ComF family protein [Chloroflexi bacterium]|nr:ComF family protein [Chloroflexota bacterium]